MDRIDFSELKQRVTLDEVIGFLGLSMTRAATKEYGDPPQWRGACPACQSRGNRSLVVTEGKGYYCFEQRKGGDAIALVAHIRKLTMRQAAEELHRAFPLVEVAEDPTHYPPPEPRHEPPPQNGALLRVADYLKYEHPDIQGLHLSPETAKRLGVGQKPKGWGRGGIALPLYDDGELVGYAIFKDGQLAFPQNLLTAQ